MSANARSTPRSRRLSARAATTSPGCAAPRLLSPTLRRAKQGVSGHCLQAPTTAPAPAPTPLPMYQEVLTTAPWPLARRRLRLRTPAAVAAYLRPWLAPCPQERCLALLLDHESHPLGAAWLGAGDPTGAIIDLRVFARCLLAATARANAVQAVLAHNHPSGRLRFSRADHGLTKQAQRITEALGVRLLDHLLFTTDGRWRSLVLPTLLRSPRGEQRPDNIWINGQRTA